jgi:Phytanoyl-CoA dioxygenase (PhyH)
MMVDEFRYENGATRFVPRSHLWPEVPNDLIQGPTVDYQGQVSACGPAGSVIIYNGSVWHGHGPNVTGANPGVRYKAPTFAVTPSAGSTCPLACVLTLWLVSVRLQGIYWPSNPRAWGDGVELLLQNPRIGPQRLTRRRSLGGTWRVCHFHVRLRPYCGQDRELTVPASRCGQIGSTAITGARLTALWSSVLCSFQHCWW